MTCKSCQKIITDEQIYCEWCNEELINNAMKDVKIPDWHIAKNNQPERSGDYYVDNAGWYKPCIAYFDGKEWNLEGVEEWCELPRRLE